MESRERVWMRVKKAGEDDCWLWMGNKDKDGYGQITIFFPLSGRRRNFRATRLILEELLRRSIYPKMLALHTCDTPGCCNPKHLFEGTNRDNMADMVAKGRKLKGAAVKTPIHVTLAARPELRPRGETSGKAKLREAQVLEIRRLYAEEGWTKARLARSYGVKHNSICAILNRRNWKHLI